MTEPTAPDGWPGPFAVLDGELHTGLVEVRTDPAALEGPGRWAVAVAFDGRLVCARFHTRTPLEHVAAPAWAGPDDRWTSSLDRAGYIDGVVAVQEAVRRGDVYQANLCRVMSVPWRDGMPAAGDVLALSLRLRSGNPAPYAAALHLPGAGLSVVCASPECFLERDGDLVRTHPVKGTATTPAGLTDKDVAENVMILDMARNDLGRVARIGSVTVERLCAVEQHPGLVHLVSTASARLPSTASWSQLLEATFPPASVTGAPKLSALELIRVLEPVPRDAYCGALGWVDANGRRARLGLTIRTFWWNTGTLHFGTGAGITIGSDPAREWEETRLKARNLVRLAGGVDEDRDVTGGTPVRGAAPAGALGRERGSPAAVTR